MEMEIVVPDEVPVMTLPRMVFFPQALMPLYIFEPRYRQMLRDVLARDRLMAVVGLDATKAQDPDAFEPPHRVATVGIIRACQKNDNGTSNLLLQGLCRAEILGIAGEEPYRVIQIRALRSAASDDPEGDATRRQQSFKLLTEKQACTGHQAKELTDFLRTVEDPDTFADLAAFSFCEDPQIKQTLLETLDVGTRLDLFNRHLRSEIDTLQLHRDLQGGLADDDIPLN